jgi:hypothetical protein
VVSEPNYCNWTRGRKEHRAFYNRFPIKPLSSKEDSFNENMSETLSNDVDVDANVETDVTPAQLSEVDRPVIDAGTKVETDVMPVQEDETERYLRNSSFLEEETLELEQLFAVMQHKLEAIKDLIAFAE